MNIHCTMHECSYKRSVIIHKHIKYLYFHKNNNDYEYGLLMISKHLYITFDLNERLKEEKKEIYIFLT